jgi:hypothetical protein
MLKLNPIEMKKLLLVLGCFVSVLSLAQETDKPYEFPIKPGMKEWANLNTSEKKDEVCVIPEQVLKSISTKALLLTCFNYPRLVDFFAANDLQKCFEFYANHFDGLKELLIRPDLNKVLLEYYPEIDVSDYTFFGESNKPTFIQIAFFELLLAQDEIIQSYNISDRAIIKNIAIKNLEIRRQKNESIGRQITNALILSRILYAMDKAVFENTDDSIPFNIFNSHVVVLDTSILDKILNKSKQL